VDATTLVDVGANIGTTSVAALTRYGFSRVLALEPEPANAALLTANLALNGLAARSTVVVAAASDRDGAATLALHPSNRGAHELAGAGESREAMEVEVKRLDTLVRERVLSVRRVGLLWLDVQGHEGHVLAGATSLLRRRVPVLLELFPDALRAAGGFERLVTAAGASYSHFVDARSRTVRAPDDPLVRPVDDLPSFAESLGSRHTDVLLIDLRRTRRRRLPRGVRSLAWPL
jgi:FkbM family methyltransferase